MRRSAVATRGLLILCLSAPALTAQVPTPSLYAPSSGPAVRLGGYIQARGTYTDGPGLVFSLNRARATVDGYLGDGFGYKLQSELTAPAAGVATVSVRDALVRWSRSGFALTAGQYKTPFSLEYVTSIAVIETADRASVVDSLAPKRDIGLMGDYTAGNLGYLAFGIFNGSGQNHPSNADTTLLLVGRLSIRPLPFLNIAANVADTRDSTRYGADLAADYRGIGLKGEYITLARDFQNSPDKGWYAQLSYRIVPWIQLVVKQEDFRRNEAITHGYKNHATTGGANLFFAASRFRITVNYVRRTLGNPGTTGGTVITQFQARF
ncbi:MAG TPA: porin [Gemmatimonadales bacterium]|nr:porin [Gemmatimonadales bacterium]